MMSTVNLPQSILMFTVNLPQSILMFTVDLHFVPVELEPLLKKGTHYIGRLLIHLFNSRHHN
jgi:hypothetical protein